MALPFITVASYDHDHKLSPLVLHLFFDKFLQPYGVSSNHTNNDNGKNAESSSVELLNALLPRPPTKEENSRTVEGFQRARLDEQLRLMKRSRRGSDENNAQVFQQARLTEQLRLSNNERVEFIDNDDKAFQRFVNTSDSIEMAMMEYENENEQELKSLKMTNSPGYEQGADNVNDSSKDSQEVNGGGAIVISSTSTNNDNGNHNAVSVGELPVNQTDNTPSKQLSDKLENLHQMVTIMTTSPSTHSGNTTFSLKNLLSTTHLPLAPREDASFLSLALTPMAHLLSCMFLLGAAGFYAVLSVLDVLWNDNKAGNENSARSCLREASSVCKNCWNYVFPDPGSQVAEERAARRTLRALYTFAIAAVYAAQGVVLRAAKHSKYANECMDAGTGALRYMVYALRSVKVLSSRLVDSLRRSYRNRRHRNQNNEVMMAGKRIDMQSLKQKLNPVRVFSSINFPNIRSTAAQRSQQRQQSLQAKQQDLRSSELHDTKLRQLNQDRVALERDRQELKEAQHQLEIERGKVLSEGVNVLAWYSAASEANRASVAEEEKEGERGRQTKKHWWRKREDE